MQAKLRKFIMTSSAKNQIVKRHSRLYIFFLFATCTW